MQIQKLDEKKIYIIKIKNQKIKKKFKYKKNIKI